MPASAKSPSTTTPFSSLEEEVVYLRGEVRSLSHQLTWFQKQLFGAKSEKRIIDNPAQGNLLTPLSDTSASDGVVPTTTVPAYERGTAKKQRPEDCLTDSGLRFGSEVPVEVITVVPLELSGPEADQYEVIDTRLSHKLAQRPSSYVVLQYEIPVIKHKAQGVVTTAVMPTQVLDGCLADVSLLAGLLTDKFLYHLPLYRQHQRLAREGITVSRASLTNWVKRSIELLRGIVESQLAHVLQSKVLAMDEVPIKAGLQTQGKMQQGYFWPIYGEDDEVVFTFNLSRGKKHIEDLLNARFQGTLVTDGYAAYARYVEKTDGVTHAQCWVHTRRKWVEAEHHDPAIAQALHLIGELYQAEKTFKDKLSKKQLTPDEKAHYRQQHGKPIVDAFFAWCKTQSERPELTPKHPLRNALNYTLNRERELRVFLDDPEVPLDTNHVEREIRTIPLGRKNWLFCWTELGAEHVGLIQSLISTCKLHDINPYTYLVDVLQRISDHPDSRIEELTPRLWKQHFEHNPLRSVLEK
jgi:transposase